jgi:hypothetical protein
MKPTTKEEYDTMELGTLFFWKCGTCKEILPSYKVFESLPPAEAQCPICQEKSWKDLHGSYIHGSK